MGAFDTYRLELSCPSCNDRHNVSGQTKFFEPEFGSYHARHFVCGALLPVEFSPAELFRARVWDDEWFRVRECNGAPGDFSLLVDYDEMFTCTCGEPLAPLLHFSTEVQAGQVCLTKGTLLRALDRELPSRVDFASAEQLVPWTGEFATFRRAVLQLAHADEEHRAQCLQAAVARRFAGYESWAEPDSSVTGWSHLVGPVQCESCRAVRTRRIGLALCHAGYMHPVLGQGWDGGVLRLGQRVQVATDWLTRDEDRGFFLRLRTQTDRTTLTIAGDTCTWGCGCGAGMASVIVRFAIEAHGFRLQSMHLRVVKDLADLADVDLVYAPDFSRAELRGQTVKRWRPKSRAQALAYLQEQLRSRWQRC